MQLESLRMNATNWLMFDEDHEINQAFHEDKRCHNVDEFIQSILCSLYKHINFLFS